MKKKYDKIAYALDEVNRKGYGIVTPSIDELRNRLQKRGTDSPEIIEWLQRLWKTNDTQEVAKGVLGATFIWAEDLNHIPGLTALVKKYLDDILEKGMLETVKELL